MAARQATRPAAGRSTAHGATPTRMAWGTMSREQVVSKATEMVTEQGYDKFTLRGLSDALGTAPMSLYRHVRNKDDLLVDVVDRLLVEVWRPTAESTPDGKAWLIESADRLRRFLVAQPAALHVYLSRPVTSPAAIERMEALLTVLRTVAASEEQAQALYAAMHTYTLGFAALEAARDQAGDDSRAEDALSAHLAAYTSPQRFAEGLSFLLSGGLTTAHAGRVAAQAAGRP